jgi:hypothetical protein
LARPADEVICGSNAASRQYSGTVELSSQFDGKREPWIWAAPNCLNFPQKDQWLREPEGAPGLNILSWISEDLTPKLLRTRLDAVLHNHGPLEKQVKMMLHV